MKKPQQHVVPRPDGWAVIKSNGLRASSTHNTQKQAIEAGRTLAQNQGTELVIHGRNGQIREKNSYGNDPFPPKG